MLPPPIKTPTRSSICNCGGIYFAVASLTLSPITGMLGSATTAAAGIEYIRVYSAIAIFVYVNIVYKRVINIAKDI